MNINEKLDLINFYSVTVGCFELWFSRNPVIHGTALLVTLWERLPNGRIERHGHARQPYYLRQYIKSLKRDDMREVISKLDQQKGK